MATIKLTPSTYYLSNSTYLSVANEDNMYNDTSNTTYATVTNSRTSTTNYYIYLRGFNFSDIPSAARINSFTIRIKTNYSGGYSQSMYLYDGTSTSFGSSNTAISSTLSTHTFNPTRTWEEIVASGSDFGIRINCRRNSRNQTAYVYIYGAEIEVDYTVPESKTVTSTLTGDGTINPNGTVSVYAGDTYNLTITPTNTSDPVVVTKNGIDVTSELVPHHNGDTISIVANNATTSGISSGSSYALYAVGNSAESPSSIGSDDNMYASSGSTGYGEYSFDFSLIPSNVIIESVNVRCYGHRESSTIDSTHVSNVAVYVNGTLRGEDVDFLSTSNQMVSISNLQVTREELDNLTLRHTVGYYGGLVLGITVEVVYATSTEIAYYTYAYTVSSNDTINVIIGDQESLYLKINNNWIKSKKIYKKINGVWTLVDLNTLTDNIIYLYLGEMT